MNQRNKITVIEVDLMIHDLLLKSAVAAMLARDRWHEQRLVILYFFFPSTFARSRSSCFLNSGVNSSPKSSVSKICRISISDSSSIGFGHFFTHSIASASDLHRQIQNPATSSFAGENG